MRPELIGMHVLHYIEQQEKIRREKEERAYQEREEQRQEAEKRRHEARKQRKIVERQLKKQRLLREQEERALEERQRQKEDAQKAQQKDVGSPSWTCPEGCVSLSFPGWTRSGPRVESWATQKLPGEGRRSEEPPATKHSLAVIVRSREDLSQQWIRRPNGQEQKEHPESDRRAKRPRSTDQRPRSIRPRMEVSAGKARAQEAQSAEARAPVTAWAPEEPPAEARASEEQPAEARAPEEPLIKTCAPEEPLPEARTPEEQPAEARAPEEPLIKVRAPEESPAEARAPEEPLPETRTPEVPLPETRAPEEPPLETCAPEELLPEMRAPDVPAEEESGENDDLADKLADIGRPPEKAMDVESCPKESSRMSYPPKDPPTGSRSPEELLAEEVSSPKVLPAQLPRTGTTAGGLPANIPVDKGAERPSDGGTDDDQPTERADCWFDQMYQRIVTDRSRDHDRRNSADDGRAGPGATLPPSSGFRGRDVRPCWKRSLA
ncbi:neurofilament heavy polypeptide-like [Penaeus japonicus]|uniref:neurofilament heavy polypeptide-like n=1 Tax=Penaeus japonicus TaxID=27405 RepID=UPI001C70C677|nr:neurofilament heavy polypeptide-like [Penaeus japonicus]